MEKSSDSESCLQWSPWVSYSMPNAKSKINENHFIFLPEKVDGTTIEHLGVEIYLLSLVRPRVHPALQCLGTGSSGYNL